MSSNLIHLTFLFIARTAPAQGKKVSVITFGSHEGSSKQGLGKSNETEITPQPSTSQTTGNYEEGGARRRDINTYLDSLRLVNF